MSLWRLCVLVRAHSVCSRPAVDALCRGSCRASSGSSSGTVKDREPLKKAKTPQGRFDQSEKSEDVLQKFPDDVNPITKEKGGPRGPEPTRYGDWERKGRCVDF